MKARLAFFGMFLALLLAQACSESKFDYRHKYVGDYDAEAIVTQQLWNTYPDGMKLPVEVNVAFGDDNDALVITVSPDTTWPFVFLFTLPVTVDRHRELHSATDTSFAGHFVDKDHLEFEFLQFPLDHEHSTWHVKGSKP